MNVDLEKFLVDIKMAMDRIDVHLQRKRDWNLFSQSITVQSAVKYEFSVIGEAVYELMKLKPDFTITNAIRIIGFRNRMVHEYDAIDNAQVWNIVVNYLPVLQKEVEELLAKK